MMEIKGTSEHDHQDSHYLQQLLDMAVKEESMLCCNQEQAEQALEGHILSPQLSQLAVDVHL